MKDFWTFIFPFCVCTTYAVSMYVQSTRQISVHLFPEWSKAGQTIASSKLLFLLASNAVLYLELEPIKPRLKRPRGWQWHQSTMVYPLIVCLKLITAKKDIGTVATLPVL